MTYKRSFTLLESIIAIYVFLLGIVGAMTLANAALSSTAIFKDQLIASNLAQEGVEIVRNMRDTDFLSSLSGFGFPTCRKSLGCDANKVFNDYLNNLTNDPTIIKCKDSTYGCYIDPLTLTLTGCPNTTASVCSTLLQDANGFYQYTSGSPTRFDRRIFFLIGNPPRQNEFTQTVYDWQIRSVVYWKRRFGPASYEVDTQLTPWLE